MLLIKLLTNVYYQIIASDYDNLFLINYDKLFSQHGQVFIQQYISNIICLFTFFVKIDCQITLYGSLLFECCLEKPGIMDIDIQFKQTLQYDTLKELFEIISQNGMCLF